MESIEQYKQRIADLERTGSLDSETHNLVNDLVQDLDKCIQLNLSLRKTILKSNSKESRMSTKLRDALYE